MMLTPEERNERRKAKNKRKRAERKAGYEKRKAEAEARDRRYLKNDILARLQEMRTGEPRPPIPKWEWDTRVKPPEA